MYFCALKLWRQASGVRRQTSGARPKYLMPVARCLKPLNLNTDLYVEESIYRNLWLPDECS